MSVHVAYTALGLALIAGAPAAHAQTVITREIVTQTPAATVVNRPVRTVRTVETVRTVRPATRTAARRVTRRRVVTTTRQTIVRERVIPTQTVAAPAVAAIPVAPRVAATYPQPFYQGEEPVPVRDYGRPLYDEVPDADGTIPIADELPGAAPLAPVGPTAPYYRYVYQPDRILVIDPSTNLAVGSIPR